MKLSNIYLSTNGCFKACRFIQRKLKFKEIKIEKVKSSFIV